MFEAVGKKVIYLKRLSMGNLRLDENLKLGECKELGESDIELLKQAVIIDNKN
jgi:16S rRNA pseudouridine516 synthase